ncbi:MAG: DUF1320 domain-containing protein [Rhodospirillales bacterium CG15_BIG_FIL_POST_REV_8_21_14_020_66_15]|nr:MAG: DUF1320 domain-containing protein [Rhodospirillales bacterium CG15_BIG_FIL_POST_REV_8_21_14_020_66_15]
MPYATKQDLIDRFGEDELIQLTDRGGAGVIADAVLNMAMADADATIDSYLAKRYDLPLAEVPPALVPKAAALVRYLLHDESPTETVVKNHELALAWLRDVAAGRVELDVGGSTPAEADIVLQDGAGPVFTDKTMKGF